MKIFRIARVFPPVVTGTSFHLLEISKNSKNTTLVTIEQSKDIKVNCKDIVHIKADLSTLYTSKLSIIFFHIKALSKIYNFLDKTSIIHTHGDVFDVIVWKVFRIFKKFKIIHSMHAMPKESKIYNIIAKFIFGDIDLIYVVSNQIKTYLVEIGINRDKVYVITSGILFDKIPKKNFEKNNHKLITVGRLVPYKAFNILIESMQYIDKKYTLTIVGEGKEHNALATLAKNLNLEDRVILVGEKTREEIYALLIRHDIFVLSSVKLKGQEEGTPTAMMEAMGAGLPIISTDTGGTKDLLQGYPSQCLVLQNNPQELANAINWLGNDYELQKKLGYLSLDTAKTKDWSILSVDIMKLFEKVFSKNEQAC